MVLVKSSNKNLHWLLSCSFLKIEVFLQQDIIKRNTKGVFAANKLFLPQKAKLFFSSLTTAFFFFQFSKKTKEKPMSSHKKQRPCFVLLLSKNYRDCAGSVFFRSTKKTSSNQTSGESWTKRRKSFRKFEFKNVFEVCYQLETSFCFFCSGRTSRR